MSIGVLAAAQLAWPELNTDIPWLSYSRIRSNHTFGVIFAFGGSALMGTCYYVVQRTGHTRLALQKLAHFTFWGWQLACFLAMLTMPFGITQGKEYAEPEWFIDLLIAVVWVSFGTVFFATLARRRIRHIYVANWYYGAFILAVALLHIVNNIAVPVSLTKSYIVYSGVVDAMVQWWYGHNAVAFFLTAGFLGMMYYFVPHQAQQPLWSVPLSTGPPPATGVERVARGRVRRSLGLDAVRIRLFRAARRCAGDECGSRRAHDGSLWRRDDSGDAAGILRRESRRPAGGAASGPQAHRCGAARKCRRHARGSLVDAGPARRACCAPGQRRRRARLSRSRTVHAVFNTYVDALEARLGLDEELHAVDRIVAVERECKVDVDHVAEG
jgi:hypothetical protein